MADDQISPGTQERPFEGRRSGRPPAGREGGREPGGFRIRLSDNEMRAAKAVQEAFRLRSTVAALGFALRTTAQLLEEGKLDAVIEQQRSQAPERGGPRRERRDGRPEARAERGPRIDPFARPSRPAPAQPVAETPEAEEPAPEEPVLEVTGESPAEPAAEPAGEAEAPATEG
jgi:hypothetical protein